MCFSKKNRALMPLTKKTFKDMKNTALKNEHWPSCRGFFFFFFGELGGLSQQNQAIEITLHKKWSFSLRISSVNVIKSAVYCELVTFTEEIINEPLHFLCSVKKHLSLFTFTIAIKKKKLTNVLIKNKSQKFY